MYDMFEKCSENCLSVAPCNGPGNTSMPAVGAYAADFRFFDLWVMLGIGVFGGFLHCVLFGYCTWFMATKSKIYAWRAVNIVIYDFRLPVSARMVSE